MDARVKPAHDGVSLQQIGRFVAAGPGDGRGHPVTIDEELQAQAVGIPDHHAVAGGMVYLSLDRNSGTR